MIWLLCGVLVRGPHVERLWPSEILQTTKDEERDPST
jgi:hypothetical protein